MAKNRISSDVMDAMLLFLKENGNQYIKQFMQVIYGEWMNSKDLHCFFHVEASFSRTLFFSVGY